MPSLRRRQQIRALADLVAVAGGLLDAPRVALEVLLVRAAAAARAAAAGAAEAEVPETESFELGDQLVKRLGAGRRLDVLLLVDLEQLQIEANIGGSRARLPLALRPLEAEIDDQAPQDPVVGAGVDLDVEPLDRVRGLLLLLVGQPLRELLRALHAEPAQALESAVDVVEQLGHVDVAGDLDRVGVADLRLAGVLGVGEPAAGIEAERRQRLVLLTRRLLRRLLVAGLELLEDGAGDLIRVPAVGDERAVRRRRHAGLDALAATGERGVEV